MAGHKYGFNTDTLEYQKLEKTRKERLKSFTQHTITSIGVGFILLIVFSYYFNSPQEEALRKENEILLAKYTLLNKKVEEATKVIEDLEYRDDNLYRVIFEAEPIPSTIRRAGTGGVNKYENLSYLENSKIVINTSKKLDQLLKAIYVQSKSYDDVEDMVKNKVDMLASIPAILPIAIKDYKRVSSGFGYRMHPIYKQRIWHNGMDFTGKIGTPIYATGNGKVLKVGKENGHGKKIVIDHGFGYKTIYSHLSGYNVRKGQKVKRGDVIGYLGNTGVSTGPHLHYEVHKNNKANDPVNYYFNDLTAEAYDRIVEAAANTGQTMD